jgi:hypothetical protein
MSGPSYEVTTEAAIAEQRELPWTLTRRLNAALYCGLAIEEAAPTTFPATRCRPGAYHPH